MCSPHLICIYVGLTDCLEKWNVSKVTPCNLQDWSNEWQYSLTYFVLNKDTFGLSCCLHTERPQRKRNPGIPHSSSPSPSCFRVPPPGQDMWLSKLLDDLDDSSLNCSLQAWAGSHLPEPRQPQTGGDALGNCVRLLLILKATNFVKQK